MLVNYCIPILSTKQTTTSYIKLLNTTINPLHMLEIQKQQFGRIMQFQPPYFILCKIASVTLWYCFRQNIVRFERFSSFSLVHVFNVLVL
jgi:hypothetical protein